MNKIKCLVLILGFAVAICSALADSVSMASQDYDVGYFYTVCVNTDLSIPQMNIDNASNIVCNFIVSGNTCKIHGNDAYQRDPSRGNLCTLLFQQDW